MLDKVTVIVLVFVCLTAASPASCQAQGPSVSQIEKSRQDLEMDRALRIEVEKGKKVFIKKVIVKGATLITEEQLKEIILPFNNHWLTQADINLILDSIAGAYTQKGYAGQPARASFQIKYGFLEISIEEAKH